MIHRHKTFYVSDVQPINLCGKTAIWQVDLNGSFEIPFEIKPTSGENHDFNNCEKCQKTLKNIAENLTKHYQGLDNVEAFPNCCAHHKKLLNYEEFVRSKDYFSCVPEMVAKKVIYMNQHILNNFQKENWFEEITHYMDWVVESFGSMPNDAGEPLYLSHFFHWVWELTSINKEISIDKKMRIEEFIASYKTRSIDSNSDIKDLIQTYEKWIEIFPFKLKTYFGDLKEQFETRLPIFTGKAEVNPYSGAVKVSTHSKRSLILYLNELTNTLIDKIDITKLIEDGIIKDVNGHKLGIEIEKLNIETKELTKDLSKKEKRYAKTLKDWLEFHRTFFERITPILEVCSEIKNNNSKPKIVDPS